MKKIFFLFLFPITALAGVENYDLGTRSASLGGASVSLSDLWSTSNNQAGLAFVKKFSAGAYYENRFLLKELSLAGGAVAVPVKGGTFGLVLSNFGYSLYSENKYGLSFAKAFGENFAAGVQLDYLTTKIGEGYGSKGLIAGEAGLIAKPVKNLTVGFHAFNISRAKITSTEIYTERVPMIFRLGIDYKFSEKVFVAVETEKDIDYKPEFKVGIEYKLVPEFFLRAGVSTNPNLSSFGFGLNLKSVKLDVSTSFHSALGFTPSLGLAYEFAKK